MDLLFLAIRVVVSLAAVLGAIWWLQKRVGGKRRTGAGRVRPIAVLSRQSVGSKASVTMVEADGKRFLLGVTEHGITVLHSSDAPVVEEIEAAPARPVESTSASFARVLAETGDPNASALTAVPTFGQAQGLMKSSPLAGSLLSADTWKKTFAGLWPGR